jgi:hypothetical protein
MYALIVKDCTAGWGYAKSAQHQILLIPVPLVLTTFVKESDNTIAEDELFVGLHLKVTPVISVSNFNTILAFAALVMLVTINGFASV